MKRQCTILVPITLNGGNHTHRAQVSTITKRQSYWRDHVLDAADGTIVEYATLHNLKTKDIYQWKAALRKRKFLPMIKREEEPVFVAVHAIEQTDTASPDANGAVQCRLTLQCGSVLEYFTPVEPASLSRLLSMVNCALITIFTKAQSDPLLYP